MSAPRTCPLALGLALATLLVVFCAPVLGDTGEAVEDAPSVSPPSAGLAGLLGLPIGRIEGVATGFSGQEPIVIRSVRVGEPLTGDAARRAGRELLQSGAYGEVRIEAMRDGTRVTLQVRAVVRKIIASIHVSGGKLDDEEMLQEARAATGDELTPRIAASIRERALAYYVRRGYADAAIDLDLRQTDDPARVGIVMRIRAGVTRKIARRVFVHDGAIQPTPTDDPGLSQVEGSYSVGDGDILDEDALAAADRGLAERLRARAYLQAQVSHQSLAREGRHFVYVRIQTGPRYVLRFEGVRSFDRDNIEEALEMDRQPNRNTVHLATKIIDFYRNRGFLDVKVEGEERGSPTDPIHVLFFRIHENGQVRVVSRDFPCLTGGPLSMADARREIDSFLFEELPGGGFLGPVSASAVDAALGPTDFTGARPPPPLDLSPRHTYVAETYERALKHLSDYYHSQGYLSATVGPPTLIRRACDRHSPPGVCIPVPLPPQAQSCRYDNEGLPLDDPPTDLARQCTPDPGRGIQCEPQVSLQIPIKLGPRTLLYDLAFEGNRDLVENELAEVTELTLGRPVSQPEVEEARRHVLEQFREEGFAFAEVRTVLDFSSDRTRARVRFIITQGERVVVDHFVIRGAKRTDPDLIIRRVSLRICPQKTPTDQCEPYRTSRARRTEERIGTLGTFSSVSVSLEEPYVPSRRKGVIIEVQERTAQYLDLKPGFSTGEGFRGSIEYGHYNVAGKAIQVTARVQLSFLPKELILDPGVRQNWLCEPGFPGCKPLEGTERIGRTNTLSLVLPEVGLGPQFRAGLDAIDVRQNARDFGLTKEAAIPALTFRPTRSFSIQGSVSFEYNNISVFQGKPLLDLLQSNQSLALTMGQLLRAPQGPTFVVAEKLLLNWDRRDVPLGATKGTFVQASVEHVDASPLSDTASVAKCREPNGTERPCPSNFLRLSATLAGYLRLSDKGLALAVSVRGGRNVPLVAQSWTYPDRLFFLGGVGSIRGFYQDTLMPQDLADKILNGTIQPDNVPLRGGDVFVNPRLELRIPITGVFETGVFLDSGNVWVEPAHFNPLNLRYAAGAGLRIATPIGPIAFDYGVNLIKRPWEDRGNFHFSIGLF